MTWVSGNLIAQPLLAYSKYNSGLKPAYSYFFERIDKNFNTIDYINREFNNPKMELLYSSRNGRSNWTHFREAVEGKPNILTIFQTEEDFIVATYLNQPYSYGEDIYDCNAITMSVTKRRSFRVGKT